MPEPQPGDLWKKYGLRFKKSLGQNFLLDPNINRKMVEIANVGPDDQVFEVGAGIGDLTAFLIERAGYVFSMEIDASFAPVLCERFTGRKNVRFYIDDVLLYHLDRFIPEYFDVTRPIKVVANLPYYCATPIIMEFLETSAPIHSLTIMLQREVAERFVAGPGSKPYSILTIAGRCYCRASIAHYVSPNVFKPRPKVESAIVHLRRHEPRVPAEERDWFFRVVKAAFGQRRKAIRNALTSGPLQGLAKADVLAALKQCGIDPDRRGETLEFDEFVTLAHAMWPLAGAAIVADALTPADLVR